MNNLLQLARSSLSSAELEDAHQAVERDRASKRAQTEPRAMSVGNVNVVSAAASNGVAGGARTPTPRVCFVPFISAN